MQIMPRCNLYWASFFIICVYASNRLGWHWLQLYNLHNFMFLVIIQLRFIQPCKISIWNIAINCPWQRKAYTDSCVHLRLLCCLCYNTLWKKINIFRIHCWKYFKAYDTVENISKLQNWRLASRCSWIFAWNPNKQKYRRPTTF